VKADLANLELEQIDLAARAIAEPRRRAILALVRDEELSAGAIAAHFDVSRPAVSQHLTVLRSAGLLNERREGTSRLYRARPEGLADLRDFMNGFWTERLERLKLAAELEQQRRNKRGKRRADGGGDRGRGVDRRKP
jgi:DNA-binding transcriptional ArsR family regulator